jgi:hypothetical protein
MTIPIPPAKNTATDLWTCKAGASSFDGGVKCKTCGVERLLTEQASLLITLEAIATALDASRMVPDTVMAETRAAISAFRRTQALP